MIPCAHDRCRAHATVTIEATGRKVRSCDEHANLVVRQLVADPMFEASSVPEQPRLEVVR